MAQQLCVYQGILPLNFFFKRGIEEISLRITIDISVEKQKLLKFTYEIFNLNA
jgi:hypothetical protein